MERILVSSSASSSTPSPFTPDNDGVGIGRWRDKGGVIIIHHNSYYGTFQSLNHFLTHEVRYKYSPCSLKDQYRRENMPYRWKKKVDVDETIVVIKNVLDNQSDLPNWLVNTIYGAIRDSDPAMTKYFYTEVKRYVPATMKYFEEGSVRTPI